MLLERFGLSLVVQPPNEPIMGSFWGDSEAGIVGHEVFVRADTPVHSLLHETAQKPFFRLLGTPPENKKQIISETKSN